MKTVFGALTVVLLIMGIFFYAPILIVAVITGILAIGMSPGDRRADGKKKSGGLLGGLIDSAEVSSRMRDCPFCGNKIFRKAVKCQYCGENVIPMQEGIWTRKLF